jgi:hypothetical protein
VNFDLEIVVATEKQIAANRANALKSTGPRSLAGKTRSSRNSLGHGLTAKQALLPGECPNDREGLRHSMFSSLAPQGALENQLVERIVSLTWRLRRVETFEIALFEWAAHYQAQCFDSTETTEEGLLRNEPDATPDLQDSLTFGRMFETLLSEDLSGKLGRYETSMQRQLSQVLKDLRELQAPRKKFDREVRKEAAVTKVKAGHREPEYDHAYWVEQDRQRALRMDPP